MYPHKILVVDDSLVSRTMMEKLLLALRCESLFAGDGAEAIEIFLRNPDISAILMDVRMPKSGGIDTVASIRRLSGPGLDVPILMLTAADDADVRRACRAAGANDFLVKPVDARLLLETLRLHIPNLGKPA